jgi:hypothetical protein
MSAGADTLTYDISPARRPSLDDMGGASCEDDAKNPPDPETMATAAQYNQIQGQCQALAKVAASFILGVTNDGTGAGIYSLSATGTNITTGTFTVARTGTGIVQITWPSGTFPTAVADASVQMTADGAWCQPIPIAIANGVEVKTRDQTGALADGAFTITFY